MRARARIGIDVPVIHLLQGLYASGEVLVDLILCVMFFVVDVTVLSLTV